MRIYLAATQGRFRNDEWTEKSQTEKPKYLLETFVEGEKNCMRALESTANENFLLDSGAFSYLNGQTIELPKMEEYVERYIDFLQKSNIQYFFEMDVDALFGIKSVEKWRKKIERETGRQSIPVWHKQRGIEYWKNMCEEYTFVAIGGFNFDIKKREYDLIRKMVDYAADRGVKVHGLGFTNVKILKTFRFYSVDSTTWLSGAVRGKQLYLYANGTLSWRYLNQGKRKVDIPALEMHNLKEWTKYQKYMDTWRGV